MSKEAGPGAAKRIQNFRRWFGQNGGSVHASVDILYSVEDGVHVRANAPLERGAKIITCPHRISLSCLNAIDLQPTFPGQGAKPPGKIGRNSPPKMPNGLVESAPSRQAAAAVWLCVQQKLGATSFWRPYIDCLPHPISDKSKQLGLGVLDTPLYWTELEREWFTQSPLEKGIRDLEGMWRNGWDEWGPKAQVWARSYGITIDWEQYKWALSIFGSRAFSSATLEHATMQRHPVLSFFDPDALLYPGIDLLNHSPTTLNRWVYDDTSFSLVCNDPVQPGEQVFNTYGAKNNGQLMLSYGFCLPHNIHDAYPLRLPPGSPSCSPLTPADLAPQSNALFSANDAENAILRMKPSVVPDGHDPTLTTFYVRAPGSGNAERSASRPHYPPLNHIFSVSGRIRDDQLLRDAEGILANFPTALLNRLAVLVQSPREAAHISLHTPAVRAALRSNGASGPARALLAVYLGARNWLAVAALLLDRLRLEARRLSARLDLSRSSASLLSRANPPRFRAAFTYMMGLQTVLQPTVLLLAAGIRAALAPRAAPSVSPPALLTLPVALAHLAARAPRVCAALLAGFAGTTDAGLAVARARSAGAEEDLWTLWVGVMLALPLPSPLSDGGADESEAAVLARHVVSWAAQVAAERPAEHADEDTAALVAHVAELVDGVRRGIGGGAGSAAAGVWSAGVWTPGAIERACMLVRHESVAVGVQDGVERGAAADDCDDNESEERCVVLCLDAGFGGDAMLGSVFQ